MQGKNETKDEMVGMLTAISIVSRRLAKRLIELEKGEEVNEQDETTTGEYRKTKNINRY